MKRSAGILMHISSLPSKFGIGTLGKEAYKFADFLKLSNQKYWQILPVGPTGYGNSPYQSPSAFAGNPYFIDFDLLYEDELLNKSDYENIDWGNNPNFVDYKKIYENRFKVLRVAFNNFKSSSSFKYNGDFKNFLIKNTWVHNYALFMALKDFFNMQSFKSWPQDLKDKSIETINKYKALLQDDINFYIFVQFIFFRQWYCLKKYVNSLGIKIIGDLPIYVASNSTEVFFDKENFLLDNNYNPKYVAGCPCDELSPGGQIWEMPLYDWEYMKKNNYSWFINRIKYSLKLFDLIRLDHFRGFESFFCIKNGAKTAKDGFWKKGPGISFFKILKKEIGRLPIIAEDLGFLTKDVKKLLKATGLPGMKVLEFAFNSDSKNLYLPHNYKRNSIVYTSTHDCNTITGWLKSATAKELNFISDYSNVEIENLSNWSLINLAYSSVANLAVIPMQDFLALYEKYRMNTPSTVGDNWRWRLKKSYNDNFFLSNKIKNLVKTFGRG